MGKKSFKIISIKEDKTKRFADPAPLGMAAAGIATLLFNLYKCDLIPSHDGMIIAMGIMIGGFVQIVAGMMSFIKRNTFGTTFFTSYGFFWVALSFSQIFPHSFGVPHAKSMTFFMFFLAYSVVFFFLTVVTFKLPFLSITQVIFVLLLLHLILISLSEALFVLTFDEAGIVLKFISGISGVIVGVAMCYLSAGEILKLEFGKVILPLYVPMTKAGRAKANES